MAGSTNEIDIIQSFQVDGCNTVKAFIGNIGLSYTPTAFNVEYEPITWTLDSFGGDIQNAVINPLTGEITYDAATVLVNNGNANFVVTATDDLGTKVTKNFCFKISDPILSINLACNGDLQEYRNDIVQKLVLFAKAESGYLFQNLAKTIPAINDGDPVFVVENSTGLGDIVAENGTPKLSIDNVDVGLNSIEFDGFSNLQYQPLTVPSQGDAFKLVFLAKVDATNNFATFISGTDATLGQDAILKSGTWQLANYNGFLSLRSGIDTGFTSITLGNYAGTAYVNSITPWQDVNNGQYHLFAADYDGTNFKLYFNGQLVLDVVPISDFYGSSINLFRNINQAAYLKGHLAEFIYGDNTMTYADFIDTQAYFICKYGLDASLLAYASPFAVDLDNCYETISQFEYQKLSNGTEFVYDNINNTYYTLDNVPTPGLGLLKTPQCGGESTPNIDYVLYATDNVVPTLAPPNGVDTTVLLDGTRYEWNGTQWILLPGATFDSTVDFNTTNPNTGGPVFTPNTPASTTVLYVSSVDGSQWTYNGTTYVTAPVSSDWKVTGNAGTVQATNFLGTTDNIGLSFRTNNVIRQTITNNGNVGIGTTTPNSNVHINGSEAGTIINITATTTLNATHHKVLVSNGATNITITLPNALTCLGREYVISRAAGSTGTITIAVSGGNQVQASVGTIGATTSIGLHSVAGGGLRHSFTAANIGGVGFWVRI